MTRIFNLTFMLGFVIFIGTTLADDAADFQGKIVLVFTQDGAPVNDVVMLIDDDQEAKTDQDGKAEIIVTPGKHIITLLRDDLDVAVQNIALSDGEELTLIAETQADADVPAIEISSVGVKGASPEAGAGTITGQIISGINSEPLAGAEVVVLGSAKEAVTDEEGRFKIDGVPGGSYGLTVSEENHRSFTMDHFAVVADEPINLAIDLFPVMKADIDTPLNNIAIEEVVVTAKYIADEASIAGAIESVRLSSEVSEIISADEMAAAGASDAADALVRVTGITVQEDNFVNVRGLPERYTKTVWNGSELPSPDPNRRIIPLDLFPTNVLNAVQVQKTFSADLPGSFGAGLVDLQTVQAPDEGFFRVRVGSTYNSQASFDNGFAYEGGDYDETGIDDDTRAIPDEINEATQGGTVGISRRSFINPDGFTPEELEQLGESFPNTYEIQETTLEPDTSFRAAGGNIWDLDWGEFGFVTSFIYRREFSQKIGPENTFGLSGDTLLPRDRFEQHETEKEITLGGMTTLDLSVGEHSKITSNTFLMRKTTDGARTREGLRAENNEIVREFTLEWVERELFSQQLLGEHTIGFLHDLELDWRALYAKSKRDSPDRRFYRYTLQNDQTFVFEESSLVRRFAKSEDRTLNFGFDVGLPLGDEDKIQTTLKSGWSYLDQKRESDLQLFQFVFPGTIPQDIASQQNPEDIFTPENISPSGFVIDDLTGANDDATGDQKVKGYYFMADTYLFDLIRLNAGVRFEDADLEVLTFQEAPGATELPVEARLEESNTLPGVTATWFVTEEMQFRLGWGKTVSRPNLRELSPARYIDPVTDDPFIGNADLVSTEITHYDARWEWYFGDSENVTIGVFYNDFSNPIETIRLPGFNTPRTFQNADTAEAYGLELGFRKSLEFMGEWLTDVSIAGNLSLIESQVQIAEDSLFTNTKTERELQGQAPYIGNLALAYTGEDTQASLLFNIVGERISEVGVQGQPDVKQQPSPRLDFILRHQLTESVRVRLAAQNLLNPATEFKQGSETQRSRKTGIEFGAALTWELF